MSETKDQNPESNAVAEDQIKAMDINEIDQVIGAEDPDFLKKLGTIKIDSEGIDLAALEKTMTSTKAASNSLKILFQNLFNFSKNPKMTLLFWISAIGLIALLFMTWGLKKNLIHQKLFLTSMAELGETVRDYNPLTEVESFYDNPKFSKNIVTLSKMFINLQASETSGPSPMLALEINIEGISSDAIIEIKDREAEFKDLLLRTTEEKTYDELLSANGKQTLCDQFRQLINSHLTRGQVRKVLLNSFVIKP